MKEEADEARLQAGSGSGRSKLSVPVTQATTSRTINQNPNLDQSDPTRLGGRGGG